jgi:hypothetical protein
MDEEVSCIPDQRCRGSAPSLTRESRAMIGRRLHAVYFPLDNTPIPTEQIELLLALRGKERESRRSE